MSKRLSELDATFVGAGGAGISRAATGEPVPERHGVGVSMDCPCGCEHHLYVPFENPLDGGLSYDTRDGKPWGWKRTGETLETLTLSPSVQRHEPCPRKWHGYITDGEAREC